MPRIDPQQLLNCLQVLLSPQGGILSTEEVARLANLMTKFSKKLVSKCIYVLILKNTEPTLLSAFMGEGGWNLIQLWLQDGTYNKNWALVSELLELLLITPVDVERLKINNLPKIVKSLTKRDDLDGIQHLSTQLVQQWLKIVKDVTQSEAAQAKAEDKENDEMTVQTYEDVSTINTIDISSENTIQIENDANTYTADNGYRLVLRDGKQILCKLADSEDVTTPSNFVNNKAVNKDEHQTKKSSSSSSSKHKSSSSKSSSSRDKDKSSSSSNSSSKNRERSSSSSSNKLKSSSNSSSRDRDRSKSSSSHSSSKHKSSSSSSSKPLKDKEKERRDSKDTQADKDKDTLAKIQPVSLQKLGKIPKKSDKREETKTAPKPSFSVEVRKSTEEKPKTVKIYNSKMRSTGLLDEAKPAPPRPSRPDAKKQPSSSSGSSSLKRPSPPKDTGSSTPPEKKSRLSDPAALDSTKPERPGSIKLIPPKPKPAFLQESDIFMDALAASATKSPKKRKRKLSVSKEAPSSPPAAPKPTPASPTTLKNITPANFYQDTLQSETTDDSDRDKDAANNDSDDVKKSPEEPSSDEATAPPPAITKTDINGLKGVLCYSKRKGPKKSIRWKPESDLVEIQYFELDETERINVTKTFMDMARMEMSGEREALLKSRKLINEDIMDAQTAWRVLLEVDIPTALVQPGFKSIEKEIQFAREKNVLQAIYFSKLMLPDSGAEPDPETHPMSDPVSIPLEDAEHGDDNLPVHSWPEPKGSPPRPTNPPINIFPTNPVAAVFPSFPPGPVLPNNFPPGVVPPFGPDNFMPPPNMMVPGVEWSNEMIMGGGGGGVGPPVNGMFNNGPPPNFLPNKNGGFVPPPFANGPIPPPPFGPPHGGGPPPGNFGPPGRGRGNFNNMLRGRGGSGWVRMSGNNSNTWNRNGPPGVGGGPPPGAPGPKRGRFCNNVKNHGFCRNRDTCPFIHPN